eukprot:752011-Prymnesium_polylepis.2
MFSVAEGLQTHGPPERPRAEGWEGGEGGWKAKEDKARRSGSRTTACSWESEETGIAGEAARRGLGMRGRGKADMDMSVHHVSK